MFASYRLISATFRSLLPASLYTGCQSASGDLQSPGGPDPLKADLSPGPIVAPGRIRLDALLHMTVAVENTGQSCRRTRLGGTRRPVGRLADRCR